MSHLIRPRNLSINVGTVKNAQQSTAIELSDADLAAHMALYGGTGKGKSKLLELVLRQIIDQHRGACIIDPHGDLVEDLLAYIMRRPDALESKLLSRVHYFDPGSPKHRFSFDPFRYQPLPDGDHDYDDWLKAKVESTAKLIIRKQGEADFQGRPRLEQYLTAILYCVGTRLNAKGDHLPLCDAHIFLDKRHPRHVELMTKVARLIPQHILSDLEEVLALSLERRREMLGSTIGRLRSFFTPVVSSLFTNEAKTTVDFRKIVEQQGIVLVNLRRTRSFSIDQGNAIGGMFINEILEAAETADRRKRLPFFLFIDEASRFVGQDLLDALGQFRKWKLSLCLAVQDLSALKTKEIDMVGKVMSQCDIQVCFQQKYPDDVETFGRFFGVPSLDFTPLLHEVDRPDGYFPVDTEQRGHSTAKRSSNSSQESSGYSEDRNRTLTGYTDNKSRGRGSDTTDTDTLSLGTQYLSKTRVDIQETGKLRAAVMDQIYRKMHDITKLGRGEAMVFAGNSTPFTLKVHRVQSPFSSISSDEVADILEKYKARICVNHSYSYKKSKLPNAGQMHIGQTDFPNEPDKPPDNPSPFH